MADDKNLYYLDELSDYKVADDYCDVRGWDVKDAENRTIGKVDNLLVNKTAKRVVYLDVEVNDGIIEAGHETYGTSVSEGIHEFLNKDGDNHLIIPIGLVTLDEENETVVAKDIKHNTFSKTRRFSKGAFIERDLEITTIRSYTQPNVVGDPEFESDNFYDRKTFENNLIKRKL